MIGGPYVWLGIAVATTIMAATSYVVGRSDGRSLERSVWAEQQNTDLREANRALDAAHKKARDEEQESAKKVAAVSGRYQKDIANANRAKTLAMDALRASGGGLRVSVTGCEATSNRPAEAAASASRRDGGAASGFLAENDAAFLLGEASRADEVTLQLRACQAVVRADRGEK